MEKDAAREARRREPLSLGACACALSVASVAFCVLLSINAAELRNRVRVLDRVLDQVLERPAAAREDVELLVEQKVEQLLTQVSREARGASREARGRWPRDAE